MAAPRKNKTAPADSRAFDKEPDNLAAICRQSRIDSLRVDPLGDEPLACVLAPVILNRATEADKAFVGELFSSVLATGTPEQIAGFFARVSKLATNAEQRHRNTFAYFGYARFIEETGREPSKPELKAYLLARPETFTGMPRDGADAKKQWTRLWKDCGLFPLPDKVGKKP